MKNILIAILITLHLSLFSQNEITILDQNNHEEYNNNSYKEEGVPGIELPTANSGADLEDNDSETESNTGQTSKIYIKVNLNNATDSEKFVYNNSFTDPNTWEKPFKIIFSRQSNNLWSIETIVKDAKMAKISINNEFTNSNIVLAQFSNDGNLAWITDIAGNRITTGDIAFRLHLLYLDGRDQVILISLGEINTSSAIQMSKDPSSVDDYQQN